MTRTDDSNDGKRPDRSDAKRRRLVRPPETKGGGRREAAEGRRRWEQLVTMKRRPYRSDVERDVHVFTTVMPIEGISIDCQDSSEKSLG